MLEVRNLGVRYGRHLALEHVSASIAKGEICVILGANGAGKSSLLKAIAGMVKTEPGSEVLINGKPITGMKPHKIVEEGIALVPEGRGIFGDLTVAENLQLGAFAARARGEEATTLKLIYELFPRLAERRKQIARTMSGGEQQMVAIGRALMSKPDILMLDEPSLGLSPLLSKELFKSLAQVANTGVGILLVEQNARLSLKIAQRGYLIENGLITGENEASALMNDPAVVNAYLGGKGTTETPQRKVKRSGIRLPPPFVLPSTLDAMGRLMGHLADRAGRIHAAFIKALRIEARLPSAFLGRYDPALESDPWAEVEAPRAAEPEKPRMSKAAPSSEAARISDSAETLAQIANVRLAAHIRARRFPSDRQVRGALMGSAPSAKPKPANQPAMPKAAPWPERPSGSDTDFDALTAKAHERLRGHLEARRAARGAVSSSPEASSGQDPAPPPSSPASNAGTGSDIADMVAAADRRLRTFMAEQRGRPDVQETREMPVAETHPASEGERDIEALARKAGERLRGHLQTHRDASLRARVKPFEPQAGQKAAASDDEAAPSSFNGSGPQIGHNSAGLADAEEALMPGAGSDSGPDSGLNATTLSERAARIHAEFVAARRKSLTILKYPAGQAGEARHHRDRNDASQTSTSNHH